jgi:hypothetical protein
VLRLDRGVARARYDGARGFADRSAVADRRSVVLAGADRCAEHDGDGLGVSTAVDIPAHIFVGLGFAVADGFHVRRVGVTEPAFFGDGFGLGYIQSGSECVGSTGQG